MANQRRVIFWLVSGTICLAGLFFPTAWLVGFTQGGDHAWYENFFALLIYLLPLLAFVIAAALLNSGMNLIDHRAKQRRAIGLPPNEERGLRILAIACLVLCAGLTIKALNNLYWLFAWDTTYDSLDILWLIPPSLTAFIAGLVLSVTLPERTKWYGLIFLLFVPGLLTLDYTLAKSLDFRQATEARAGRVNRAVQAYFSRQGRYPASLQELVPGTILDLSEPMILYAQDWCYQTGDQFYRLGYVNRGHWSDPNLVGQVFAEHGFIPPDLPAVCAAEIAALEKSNPFFTQSR